MELWARASFIYLFVEAQELTVAHPAVQDTVDVDVVGLRGRREEKTH